MIRMALNKKERKALLNARLRNMKRRYSKMRMHHDLIDETIDLKADIDALQREIDQLQ